MKKDTTVAWRRADAAGLNLSGFNAAVVGGTGGIGRALSRLMASRGANVTVVGQTFRDAKVPGIQFLQADLGLMREAERVAAALPAESLDLVVFTTGIFAAPAREQTAEGIEKDMAVSYLSRLVITRGMEARLGTNRPNPTMKPRVFVMGFPGNGQTGTLDDLNAEKTYKAMAAHMNTVAGNEALVLDGAQRNPHLNVFGLNPGLIKTNIRSNLMGANSTRFRIMESLIGLLTPSADTYAQRIVPLLVSPDIEGNSGAMFDRKGNAVMPSQNLDDAYVKAFTRAAEALVSKAGVRVA